MGQYEFEVAFFTSQEDNIPSFYLHFIYQKKKVRQSLEISTMCLSSVLKLGTLTCQHAVCNTDELTPLTAQRGGDTLLYENLQVSSGQLPRSTEYKW